MFLGQHLKLLRRSTSESARTGNYFIEQKELKFSDHAVRKEKLENLSHETHKECSTSHFHKQFKNYTNSKHNIVLSRNRTIENNSQYLKSTISHDTEKR